MTGVSNGGTNALNPGWWYDGSPIHGPKCPSCYRDDWTHTLGCPVEHYYREWERLFREREEENAERLFSGI